jgi:hypothetical protein
MAERTRSRVRSLREPAPLTEQVAALERRLGCDLARAGWLVCPHCVSHVEPYGGDKQWRRQMWGAIVALHGRYPAQFEALKDKWWKDESQTETLFALAVWRAELDDTGQDPREELAFQNQLADYAQILRQQGGGVTKAWRPGAPPAEWARK